MVDSWLDHPGMELQPHLLASRVAKVVGSAIVNDVRSHGLPGDFGETRFVTECVRVGSCAIDSFEFSFYGNFEKVFLSS